MTAITLFRTGRFIVRLFSIEVDSMLFLSAIVGMSSRGELGANDLLAEARQRIGHVGFALIALVFVLLSFWQS